MQYSSNIPSSVWRGIKQSFFVETDKENINLFQSLWYYIVPNVIKRDGKIKGKNLFSGQAFQKSAKNSFFFL